jgi:uncharacterized protein YjbI with pentapeptide repeats
MRRTVRVAAIVCGAWLVVAGQRPPGRAVRTDTARDSTRVVPDPAARADSAAARRKAALDVEKLQAEIAKLRAETAEVGSYWNRAPFISAVVGVAALLGAAFRYLRQIRTDREQEADRSFAAAVELLGSDKPNARASGAVSIVVFADEKYGRLRRMVVDVIVAQLRLAPEPAHQRLLASSLGRAAALIGQLDDLEAAGANLSHVELRDVALRRADLTQCRVEGARFQRTALTGATLDEAECRDTQFVACDLTGATFDHATLGQVRFAESDLGGATFVDARLRTCTFGARLRGATFRGCELFQCDFAGADLTAARFEAQQDIDLQSARSLRGAAGFDRAELADAFRAQLDALSGGT